MKLLRWWKNSRFSRSRYQYFRKTRSYIQLLAMTRKLNRYTHLFQTSTYRCSTDQTSKQVPSMCNSNRSSQSSKSKNCCLLIRNNYSRYQTLRQSFSNAIQKSAKTYDFCLSRIARKTNASAISGRTSISNSISSNLSIHSPAKTWSLRWTSAFNAFFLS